MKSREEEVDPASLNRNPEVGGNRIENESVLEHAARQAATVESASAAELSDWDKRESAFMEHTFTEIGLPPADAREVREEFRYDDQIQDVRTGMQRAKDFALNAINRVTGIFKRDTSAGEQPVDSSRYQPGDFMKDEERLPDSAAREAHREQKEGPESRESVVERFSRNRTVLLAKDIAHKVRRFSDKMAVAVEDSLSPLPVFGPAFKVHEAIWGRNKRTGEKYSGKERLALLGEGLAGVAFDLVGGAEMEGIEGAAKSTQTIARFGKIFKDRGGEKDARTGNLFESLANFLGDHDDIVRDFETSFQES